MSSNLYEKCSVGLYIDSECHLNTYTDKKLILNIAELPNEEKEILRWRIGLTLHSNSNICSHYYSSPIKYYGQQFKKCCDPSEKHKKHIKNGLRSISLQMAKNAKRETSVSLVPGQKLCSNCRKKLFQGNYDDFENTNDNNNEDEEPDSHRLTPTKEDHSETTCFEKEDLNLSMRSHSVSPLKLKSLPKHSRLLYGKRKVAQVTSKIKSKVAKVLELPQEEFQSDRSTDDDLSKESVSKRNANDLNYLINQMKEKLKFATSTREKLHILTIALKSWSRMKISTEFNVTEYMARKSRQLTKERGILPFPEPLQGRKISVEVAERVINFYQVDENSRLMPGAKDKLSVSRKVYEQKRLILCNLKELYTAYKEKFPCDKIGFSKFCELRPKWCVTVGQPGTHSVCVCSIHQNPILLLSAMNLEKSKIKDLIDLLVCDREKRDCMLRVCPKCPNSGKVVEYIRNIFQDFDDEDEIKFSQWVTTDRSHLQTLVLPLCEFSDLFVKKLKALIPHSFISKQQSRYVKHRKENVQPNEMLILMDFAENFSFVIQDKIQSYHWVHAACTVHPVVLYFIKDEEIHEMSLCFISDYLNHDVLFVYEVQRRVSLLVHEEFPSVNQVEYITDGCAAQYKNFKSLVNLCHHFEDFDLRASWTFHATSHGKTACDGVGGSVKRTVSRASLQRPYKDQIYTTEKMLQFCNEHFSRIKFQLIKEDDIYAVEEKLNKRFSEFTTVPGTRSFHYFTALSKTVIAAKRMSYDENFSLEYSLTEKAERLKIHKNTYVCSVYDDKCYIGLVLEKEVEEEDAMIKFMHPHWPAKLFYWPEDRNYGQEDACWVPCVNILCTVDVPELETQVGRVHYKLTSMSEKKIRSKWSKWSQLFHKLK